MKIIAGRLGGRHFNALSGNRTHPMSEKARGAMFNMLGDIKGLTVLDPFAGSGALSFEAISRGAESALLIEIDHTAQDMIKRSCEALGLEEQIRLIPGNCLGWSGRNKQQQFDLVLCDPPYDRILIGSIERLSTHVKIGGMLVLSWPKHLDTEELKTMEVVKVGKYGDAQLVFYRRTLLK